MSALWSCFIFTQCALKAAGLLQQDFYPKWQGKHISSSQPPSSEILISIHSIRWEWPHTEAGFYAILEYLGRLHLIVFTWIDLIPFSPFHTVIYISFNIMWCKTRKTGSWLFRAMANVCNGPFCVYCDWITLKRRIKFRVTWGITLGTTWYKHRWYAVTHDLNNDVSWPHRDPPWRCPRGRCCSPRPRGPGCNRLPMCQTHTGYRCHFGSTLAQLPPHGFHPCWSHAGPDRKPRITADFIYPN